MQQRIRGPMSQPGEDLLVIQSQPQRIEIVCHAHDVHWPDRLLLREVFIDQNG